MMVLITLGGSCPNPTLRGLIFSWIPLLFELLLLQQFCSSFPPLYCPLSLLSFLRGRGLLGNYPFEFVATLYFLNFFLQCLVVFYLVSIFVVTGAIASHLVEVVIRVWFLSSILDIHIVVLSHVIYSPCGNFSISSFISQYSFWF